MSRSFTDSHRVGAADVGADGRAHPCSIARWLQETAFADGLDSGFGAESFWIIRALTLTIERTPVFPEELEIRTWCSARAKSVAERSSVIEGDRGARVESVAIWIHVDPETRLPTRLPEAFDRIYGPSAEGRKARSSLRHPAEPPNGAEQLEWHFRRSEIDLAEHVSNLWYWQVAEEYLDLSPRDGEPLVLEAEFRAGIGHGPALVRRAGNALWIADEDGTLAATLSVV